VVFSVLLNKLTSKIRRYEKETRSADLLELASTDDVRAILKRLKKNIAVEVITTSYFACSAIAVIITLIYGMHRQWIPLIVFGLFLYGSVRRIRKSIKFYSVLKADTTHENCIAAIENVYGLDCSSGLESHDDYRSSEILPMRPRHYTLYMVISLLFAVICFAIGAGAILDSTYNYVIRDYKDTSEVMTFLLGVLATYFGAKDLVECSKEIGMFKVVYLLYKGLELFFLLPACMLSKRVFDKMWNRYYMKPLKKNMFNICVQWLLYCGDKVGMSYTQVNVLIFCIIWPLITVVSILLNVALIIAR
jgi:hypothetical protein